MARVSLAREVAAKYGVSVEDLRDKTKADDKAATKRLKDAHKEYKDGLKDGTVIDPPRTGPSVAVS